MKVPSTSSLSVYTKVLAHNLNDIRNWASLIGLLLRICWCLLSVFLIYCSDEWKKLVNLIYCFQVLFRMNFKIMYFLMKILENTPSADSAASRDSLSCQNATWGIVFFSSFYWWHIEYKGWMCERLLNLQEIYISGQNICIEVYGNSVGTITPARLCTQLTLQLPPLECKENLFEPPHDKTNKVWCMPSRDSDQPGNPPSLIRVFAACCRRSEQGIIWAFSTSWHD